MLDRHEVLAEEEFFPLAAARAKRHELAAFRSKLRALRYSEDAITQTLEIEGPYALTRLGRELWPRYVIPGNEPLSVLIRLFLLCLSEPKPLVREVLGEDDLGLLRDLRLLASGSRSDSIPWVRCSWRRTGGGSRRAVPTRVSSA